ncbi:MAG: hypothetical protein H7Y31_08950 [Chitinophagaceae bacterium]|nr:hypothetical protein [Chitinophagaceae bacterium]
MPTNPHPHKTGRRNFLGSIATGAATLGLSTIAAPIDTLAKSQNPADVETWFNQIKGKHKIVYDAPHPNGIFPFAWPRVFLATNVATGTPEKENSVVVVLRHSAVGYAFNHDMWSKYKFGDAFQAKDAGGNPQTKNAFWQPAAGTYAVPGIGPIAIGINELQESGVMFCVCEAAITVNSTVIAGKMGLKPEDVKKDWMANILPGIQPVPSGVWALGRAQEKGCGYIFAG